MAIFFDTIFNIGTNDYSSIFPYFSCYIFDLYCLPTPVYVRDEAPMRMYYERLILGIGVTWYHVQSRDEITITGVCNDSRVLHYLLLVRRYCNTLLCYTQ